MQVYIILFLFLSFYSFIGYKGRIKSNIYYFAVFILFIFAAFRGNGYDWASYENIYKNIHSGVIQSGATFVEYGFLLLCYISPTYKVLIAMTAGLSIYLTLSGVYKFSCNYFPLLALILFCTTFLLPTYMGQIRQGIAIGLTTWAIYENYINKRKLAITLVILAAFFHVSALLALAIIFIPRKQYSIKMYFILLVTFFVISNFLMPIFSNLLQFRQFGIIQKLIVYAITENEEFGLTSTIIIRILTFLLAVGLNRQREPAISYVCNIYFYGIIIYLLFGFLPQLGGRGALYFVIYEMILVPFIVSKLKNKFILFFLGYFLVLGLSAYRWLSFFSSELNRFSYIPYSLY